MARTQGSVGTETGAKLRACAEDLIAEHGYAAVSMRQIAQAVGVQVGALYRYTPDKQSLLFDLMREHLQDVLSAWKNADPVDEDAVTRLEAFCRFHIGFHLDRPKAVFIAYMELRSLTPQNYAEIEKLRNSYEGCLEAIIREGQETGMIRVPDARITTMALIGMLTGVTTWFRDDGRLSRDRVERIYWRLAQRMVKL